ncbi:AraC family transcriptional regulator [Actinomyces mediterranea]|uniref:AraC family transcriptional regulator n=1 Tax=Actinomyces mediterranea TaxID=1871028 RepID=UPI0009709C20|nr:AraC family transcriptional regulator [Actinomyces mediterranea]
MSIMENFNQTVGHIDENLLEGTDDAEIRRLSGYSRAMFARVFSIFTGMTLSEYIRGRKLTEAAFELRSSDRRVIDVALQYGFGSPDSFSAAFKDFHGCTPSEVKDGKPFRVMSKLRLTLSVTGGDEMRVSIQKKPAFVVAGLMRESIENSQCPATWQALHAAWDEGTLCALGSGQCFGMCFDVEDPGTINYLAGYDASDGQAARELGLDVVEVPENEYAIVRLEGPVPECIHRGWRYVMESFLPEHGYRHSGAPDFEAYGPGDMRATDYEMELWVPIEKM